MLEKLFRGLMSVSVAPGGGYAYAAPFSWFARITINSSASRAEVEREKLRTELISIHSLLVEGHLNEARERVTMLIGELETPK
jgi:hypothetical protein